MDNTNLNYGTIHDNLFFHKKEDYTLWIEENFGYIKYIYNTFIYPINKNINIQQFSLFVYDFS